VINLAGGGLVSYVPAAQALRGENMTDELRKSIVAAVAAALENEGDTGFAPLLAELDDDDLFGKAMVRYLRHRVAWPHNETTAALIHKFFAAREGRTIPPPDEYVAATDKVIEETFGYEMPTRAPPPTPKTKRPTRRKKPVAS
jgi:hypothetical protein